MQGRTLIVMKRALTYQTGTRLLECDAFGFKNALEVRVGAYFLNKIV